MITEGHHLIMGIVKLIEQLDKTYYYYFFSTIALTFVALVAFVGMLCVMILQSKSHLIGKYCNEIQSLITSHIGNDGLVANVTRRMNYQMYTVLGEGESVSVKNYQEIRKKISNVISESSDKEENKNYRASLYKGKFSEIEKLEKEYDSIKSGLIYFTITIILTVCLSIFGLLSVSLLSIPVWMASITLVCLTLISIIFSLVYTFLLIKQFILMRPE